MSLLTGMLSLQEAYFSYKEAFIKNESIIKEINKLFPSIMRPNPLTLDF